MSDNRTRDSAASAPHEERRRFDDHDSPAWNTWRGRRLELPDLEISEDGAGSSARPNSLGLNKGYNPYDSGLLSKATRQRKKDLRALSKWIEVSKRRGD